MKRILGYLLRTLGALITLGALPFLYLMWPVKKIQFGNLTEHRLGHLITDPLLLRREQILEDKDGLTLNVFFSGKPANQQALKMVKQLFHVCESKFLRRLSFGGLPIIRYTRFYAKTPSPVPAHDLYSMSGPRYTFTQEEEERGQAGLRALGIGPEDWFVCLHTRTPAYLDNNWNPVRDCPIENYLQAADWVVEQGGFVLRMGTGVDEPLPRGLGPRIIDYALYHHDDFMDMYLLAKCHFFLGSTSGPICLPVLQGIPSGMGNKMPYFLTGMGKFTLYIPKFLRCRETAEILTFPKIQKLGLFHSSEKDIERQWQENTYSKLGLTIIDNEPEDLVDLAKDLMDMACGRPVPDDARQLQQRYHSFHTGGNAVECAGRIAPRFILKYRQLLGFNQS